MELKDSTVSLIGIQKEMRPVLKAVAKIYGEFGKIPVITAGTETTYGNGKFIHSPGSYHPFGYALDFRSHFFTEGQIPQVKKALELELGMMYDIVYEANHFHIEYNA